MKETNVKSFAPIAIFSYDRVAHLTRTIESLKANASSKDSDLYIFSDAAKSESKTASVSDVRNYIRTIEGFKSIQIIEREVNFGLAKSIISGVTQVVQKHGRVIVLEDDMLTSPYFLDYMNSNLDLYEKDENVISIHGYMYPVSKTLPDFFFLKGADCWGWATWKRGWDLFEEDGSKLLEEIERRKQTEEFDFFGSYPYTQMLIDQISGKNNSWAIRWYASAFLKNKLTLYPGKSYIENIGNDGSGTHCSDNDDYTTEVVQTKQDFYKVRVREDIKSKNVIKEYFLNASGKSAEPIIKKSSSFIRKVKFLIPVFIKQKVKNVLIRIINKLSPRPDLTTPKDPFGFFGNYDSWKAASDECSGYDSNLILEKCKQALLQVRDGKAVAERDSVLLDEKVYSWPILAALFKASTELGDLHVLDFGGSLGSSYYQNIGMIQNVLKSWSIVEQNNFVVCGKENFQNDRLKFFETTEAAFQSAKPNVLLLSSVLPYIEDPSSLIESFLKYNFPYILIDRTYFLLQGGDRITKQVVPPWIYDASYPAWFFNQEKFIQLFLGKYELVADFDSYLNAAQYLESGEKAYERGMIFKLKT
ncbi:methyltransferase, TIGR04325 family [Leptospira ognonensis]|uniref:Methyltransferase, TIGR04325 family n=1 Tax=Leptospira ognonensis TaxID=2484945 RepID=A0A4R9JWV9_9LEPT|nr:methyltransferase, TIGR04325 family [Leptospira ognonensis]TGL56534.1 methyltransferase, TIGR04325 family [Leptospira ognonensis]